MENTCISKIHLEGAAVNVEQAAQSLNAIFQIIEESRSYAKPDGRGLRRYLVALVKWDV